MDEFDSLNLDMGENFTLRSDFGQHIGQLKDWIVLMGQLPIHIHYVIESDKANGDELDRDDWIDVAKNINENLMRGLEALTGILQNAAKDLYGDVFSPEAFVIADLGLKLNVGSLEISMDEDFDTSINQLAEEFRGPAIRALKELLGNDQVPENLRQKIIDFLQKKGE